MQQITLFREVAQEKEDVREVIRVLSHECQDCRLGLLHPNNRGLIWRGEPLAKIAVISEMPGPTEMEKGTPLSGPSGTLFEKWMTVLRLDTKSQVLITNVIQCMTPLVPVPKGKKGNPAQRSPDVDEITACFAPRCLRLLRAMPNLECVLTLGWVAARCLLGGEPKSKTHENRWFGTSMLPGIPVYCMIHPAAIMREERSLSLEGSARVLDGLHRFAKEYLELQKPPAIARRMHEEWERGRL